MKQEEISVHNAWTIYGLDSDGTEASRPFAQWGRPQDWGDPRWYYHRYIFSWETSPDGIVYVNHCHCWTDLRRETGEYAELFAPFVTQILMPGSAAELCGRDYLGAEDFWQRAWGKRPPIYEESEDIEE